MKYDLVQEVYYKKFLECAPQWVWEVLIERMQQTLGCDIKEIEWSCRPLTPRLEFEDAFIVINARREKSDIDPVFGVPINV